MTDSRKGLELSLLSGSFAICRLAADSAIPAWATQSTFFSVTRTAGELSVVCPSGAVPTNTKSHSGWRAFKVHGPFALSETGVLAALAAPLADARISLFMISTFDTDYLLVDANQLRSAIQTLERAGHKIHESP